MSPSSAFINHVLVAIYRVNPLMRKNFPVTQVETQLRPDQYLISKTDLKGRITYANPAFIEISGFTRDELIGKAHNIVRHPDMPPAGFHDLWETLKAQKPWLGLVKNRRKDGGYYWVQALVSPLYENQKVVGYASVRVRPSAEQIAQAEQFYQHLNKGRRSNHTLKEGRIAPTGWRRARELLHMPFNRSLRSSMFRLSVMAIAIVSGTTYLALSGAWRPIRNPAWACWYWLALPCLWATVGA
ncbi:PAS domain-containing protein [Paenalcaligenes niemegkensis]|uniref:PAS domain-containing protein n=1 Tax=Paenalcaligenes niemegkensis TaxID=2895469 RepID=UPI001EE959AC|nr:PAS domain-containing protein [Paenalcaligenes niemegkensis]MCQ9616022.1 PAS domain-containing protein [Paenalcaligenes niemegkensis]